MTSRSDCWHKVNKSQRNILTRSNMKCINWVPVFSGDTNVAFLFDGQFLLMFFHLSISPLFHLWSNTLVYRVQKPLSADFGDVLFVNHISLHIWIVFEFFPHLLNCELVNLRAMDTYDFLSGEILPMDNIKIGVKTYWSRAS